MYIYFTRLGWNLNVIFLLNSNFSKRMDTSVWLVINLYGSFTDVFCSNSMLDLHRYRTVTLLSWKVIPKQICPFDFFQIGRIHCPHALLSTNVNTLHSHKTFWCSGYCAGLTCRRSAFQLWDKFLVLNKNLLPTANRQNLSIGKNSSTVCVFLYLC